MWHVVKTLRNQREMDLSTEILISKCMDVFTWNEDKSQRSSCLMPFISHLIYLLC
jgi:hypothetical protein